jgi:hypothetical protein
MICLDVVVTHVAPVDALMAFAAAFPGEAITVELYAFDQWALPLQRVSDRRFEICLAELAQRQNETDDRKGKIGPQFTRAWRGALGQKDCPQQYQAGR